MIYLFKPQKSELTIEMLTEHVSSTQEEFLIKSNYAFSRKRYISSIEYFNPEKDDEILFSFEIFYSHSGRYIDFIVLHIDDISVFKNVELLRKFSTVVVGLCAADSSWCILDVWKEKEINNVNLLRDSVQKYAQDYRDLIDGFLKETRVNADKSIYQVIALTQINPAAATSKLPKLLERICLIKTPYLKKFYTYLLLNYHRNTYLQPHIITTIIHEYDFDMQNDVELLIALEMLLHEAKQYKEVREQLKELELSISTRRNMPPVGYSVLGYYFVELRNFKKVYEVCMNGYREYRLPELAAILTEYNRFFTFKQKVSIELNIQGFSIGFSIFKYYLPFLLFFSLPSLINVMSIIVFILPIVLSPRTIVYVINEDFLYGPLGLLIVGLSVLAFIFTIIKASLENSDTIDYLKVRKGIRRLSVIAAGIVFIAVLCNIIPAIYVTTRSLDYIQTDRISGNAYVADIKDIYSVKITIIEPEQGSGACPFITDTATACSYRYNVVILEKDAKQRVLFDGHLCNSEFCMKNFIFKDKDKTEKFLQILQKNNVMLIVDYDKEYIDALMIPDSFKEIFIMFEQVKS